MKEEWIDRNYYYEHYALQGTEEWKNARKGLIVSSKSAALSGKLSIFKNGDLEHVGKIIAGYITEDFDIKSMERMSHGTKFEPIARKWYEKTYGVIVKERGLCISKSYPLIAASIDGEVYKNTEKGIIEGEGLIEIKCPKNMYPSIQKYINNRTKDYEHIPFYYYQQMQQAMFVLNKKWCDFIVYSTNDKQVFVQRIPFNSNYWVQTLPTLLNNYEIYVKPFLK